MSSTVTFSVSATAVTDAQIQTDDIEVVLMALESQRTNLLDDQLRAQMGTIKSRNDQIAVVNALLGKLASVRPSGSDVEKWANLGSTREEGRAVYNALRDQGVEMPTGGDEINEPGTGIYDAKQKTIDVWVEQLKRKLDSLNSTQQMDMVQLQSVSNKRGEAFDLLTNFLKKFNDAHSSVVRNMA